VDKEGRRRGEDIRGVEVKKRRWGGGSEKVGEERGGEGITGVEVVLYRTVVKRGEGRRRKEGRGERKGIKGVLRGGRSGRRLEKRSSDERGKVWKKFR